MQAWERGSRSEGVVGVMEGMRPRNFMHMRVYCNGLISML